VVAVPNDPSVTSAVQPQGEREGGDPASLDAGQRAGPPPDVLRPLRRLVDRDDQLGRLADRVAASFLVACLLRFIRISGRDRILVLAGQAFTAVIPLLILLAAFAPADNTLSQQISDRFGLAGEAESAVEALFRRPPDATGAFTIGSLLLLFYSVLSFAKYLQRVFEAAWELPSLGWRGSLDGLAGLGLLLTQVVALALLGGVVRRMPGGDVVTFLLSMCIAVVLWLQLQRLLLSRRVDRRTLLPGALTAGLGQAVLAVYSTIWMPHLVSANAERYGVIGVTFALLTWLIVLSAGIVVAAVVSAEAGTHGGPVVAFLTRERTGSSAKRKG
jgi:membrane protein